ncbi:sorbosone dehydrogenase family protein [Kaistia dalseonensis]|uniref:Glucose/arabinose dehydrogenase n=1 Tax=Kaistia dalseonensis TaxID=410840 RepID=A0ABU0HCZ3_9HYPH|nr:sorbosone dehydrogenase family protein [Kaistia dalseonensis]MCX5496989.1 sorbosone dehydrogenase family protein [Kaistia dalseonensis]MDQ0439615.1 glucose/arabinose dehydrogenase [Kaistia dalseonensis]
MPIRSLWPAALIACATLTAQAAEPLTGSDAFGGWRGDRPGVSRLIRPGDLPPAYATESVAQQANIVKRPAGGKPRVPPGFDVSLVAEGLAGPRTLRTAPNGDLFVAESRGGRISVIPAGESASLSKPVVFASGLNRPYGMAFYPPGPDPQFLYVAETNRVVRFAYRAGDRKASGPGETVLSGFPAGGSHWTRDIAFSADGKRLFLSVGSASNAGEAMGTKSDADIADWEDHHGLGAAWGREQGRAGVFMADPEGRDFKTFATGIRNCSGLAVQPASGALWCATNERDGLGDNLPPDYATHVTEGGFYGWPWFYIGANQDPRHAGERGDLRNKVTVPDVLIQPHSAPLGIAFYDGTAFPEAYRGDAFVALHGSWNRGSPTGYKLVRLRMQDGRPTGVYEDFVTGFVLSDNAVWGRPVGVTVGPDGALYLSEDGNGSIWRVTAVP